MALIDTAKSFLEDLKDVKDLSDKEMIINLDVLSKLLSTAAFYADEDTLKALICEVIDAKEQCTKSVSKEIVIEEIEGKTETSEKRRKMIYDTRNMLVNAEISFFIGIASHRELHKVELERLKLSCEELDMPFEDALNMIEGIRKSKGFNTKEESESIVLHVNTVGEA